MCRTFFHFVAIQAFDRQLEVSSFNRSRDMDDEGPKIYKLVHT